MGDESPRAALLLGTDAASARAIALGLGTLLRRRGARGFVVVSGDTGRDPSARAAREGVVSALLLSGLDVIDVGVASSDAVVGIEQAIDARATAHVASDGVGGATLVARVDGAPLSVVDVESVRAIAAKGDFAAGEGTLLTAPPHAAVLRVRAFSEHREARAARRPRPTRAEPVVDDEQTGLVARAGFLDEDTAVDG